MTVLASDLPQVVRGTSVQLDHHVVGDDMVVYPGPVEIESEDEDDELSWHHSF